MNYSLIKNKYTSSHPYSIVSPGYISYAPKNNYINYSNIYKILPEPEVLIEFKYDRYGENYFSSLYSRIIGGRSNIIGGVSYIQYPIQPGNYSQLLNSK